MIEWSLDRCWRTMTTPHLNRLSPSTRALVTRLTSWRTLPQRWSGGDDTVPILEQIGEANEPLAIPELMSFGFVNNHNIRAKARSIIERLFAQIPIEALPFLDESLRQSWAHLEDWYGMKPDAIENIGGSADADRLYLALVSCHRNGHVRAQALR